MVKNLEISAARKQSDEHIGKVAILEECKHHFKKIIGGRYMIDSRWYLFKLAFEKSASDPAYQSK